MLVLGTAFVAGGLRHGVQHFDPEEPRLNASLLLLVVAALVVPTLADDLHTPGRGPHLGALRCVRHRPPGRVCRERSLLPAPAVAAGQTRRRSAEAEPSAPAWPLRLSITLLGPRPAWPPPWPRTGSWTPSKPATEQLGISQTFTGLVIVAIASNAVEHVVGIRFAMKAKPEYAISTTLNSPLQVALLLTPVLVLLSRVVGPTQLNLVFPPLLVAALAMSTLVVAVIIYDGEYTWIEGMALIALYCIIATTFWWG